MTIDVTLDSSPGRATAARRSARRVLTGVVGAAALSTTTILVGATPAEAVVPGTNGRIVYEAGGEIFTVNPDGSVPLNLTNNGARDVFPAWSPDASKITFSSDRAEKGNADIYVMNADGSGVQRLTDAPGEDRGTSWTSDSKRIVFHSSRDRDASHSFDIFTMNPDGTDQTKILENGSAAYVCGDRKTGTIAFNSSGDLVGNNPPNGTDPTTGAPIRDFEIFTMKIDGSNVRQVTDNDVLDSGPKWSPDCSTISYNSLDSGDSLDIHRINADGTGDVNLTNAPGVFDAFSAFSPDGTRVVFSSDRDGNFEIYTMSSVDGSNVTRLTSTEKTAEFRADWGTGQILIDGSPQTKNDCKNDGYKAYFRPASFKNQGECVSSVAANGRART